MADELGRLEVDISGDLGPLRRELAAFAKAQKVDIPIGVSITQAQIRKPITDQTAKMRTSGKLPKVPVDITTTTAKIRRAVTEAVRKAETQGAGLPKIRAQVTTTPAHLRKAVREANAKAKAQRAGLPKVQVRLDVSEAEYKKTEKEAEALARTSPIDVPIRMDPANMAVRVTAAKELMEAALRADPLEIPVELDAKSLSKMATQLAVIQGRRASDIAKIQARAAAAMDADTRRGVLDRDRGQIRMDIDDNRARLKIRELETRAELARKRISRPIIMRVQTALRGAREDLASLDSSFNRFFRSAVRGFNITNAVGVAAFAGITAFATYEFAKVESAATRASGVFASTVVAETRAMGDEIIAINDEIRGAVLETSNEVALSTKFDVEEAAEGIQFLAQAGVEQKQALEAVGTVAEFAQAANIELQTATNDMAAGFIAAGEDIGTFGANVDEFADKLVFVAQNAPITMEQTLAAFRNTAAATFQAFNQDMDETLNVIGLFGRSGFRGEMAGTQASILIREINRSAIRKAPEEWKKLGINILDAENNAVPFSQVLDQIARTLTDLEKTEGDKAFDTLKKRLDLTERSSRGLTQILPQVQQLQEQGSSAAQEAARVGGESMGRLGVQTEIVLQTLSLQFENFVNGIQVMAMTFAGPFGEALTDFFRELNGDAEGATDQMAELAEKAGVLGESFGEKMQPVLDQLRGPEGREFFGGLREGFTSLLRGIQGMVQEFSRALGGPDSPTSTLESFGHIFRELGRVAEEVYPRVGEALGTAFAFIRDNNEVLAEFGKVLLGLVVVSKIVRIALLPLVSALSQLWKIGAYISKSGAAAAIGRMAKALIASGNANSLGRVAALFGELSLVVPLVVGAFEGMGEALDDISDAFEPVEKSLEDIGVDLPELTESLEWMAELVGGVLAGSFSAMAAAGEGAIRVVGGGVATLVEGLTTAGRMVGYLFAGLDGLGGQDLYDQMERDNAAAADRIKGVWGDASLDITSSLMSAGAKFLRPFSDELADEAESWARVMDESFGEIDMTPELQAMVAESDRLFDSFESSGGSLKKQLDLMQDITGEINIQRQLEDAKSDTGTTLDLFQQAAGTGDQAARAREALGIKTREEAIRGLGREYTQFYEGLSEGTVGEIENVQELITRYRSLERAIDYAPDDVRRGNLQNQLRSVRDMIQQDFNIDMKVDLQPQLNRFSVQQVRANIDALVEQKRIVKIDGSIPADVKAQLIGDADRRITELQGYLDNNRLRFQVTLPGFDDPIANQGSESAAQKTAGAQEKLLLEAARLVSQGVGIKQAAEQVGIAHNDGLVLALQQYTSTALKSWGSGSSEELQAEISANITRAFNNVSISSENVATINEEFYARGRNASESFLDGLQNNADAANAAGSTVATAYDDGIREALQIASPSALMISRGAQTVAGFIIGIHGGIAPTTVILKQFGDAALEALEKESAALAAAASAGGFTIMEYFGGGLRLGYETQVLPWLRGMTGRLRLYLNVLGTAVSTVAGRTVMRGFKTGMSEVYESEIKPFVTEIADWIKENKGPLAYDAQLLQPAGQAIMSGFHRGLSDGFGEIKGWIKQVGPDFAKHTIPKNLFFKRSATFLLDNVKADAAFDPSEVFADLLPEMVMGSGALGADTPFGQSSGLQDTIRQALMISEAFGIPANVPSARRRFNDPIYNAAIGGAVGSKHVSGLAMDFGLAGTTASALDEATAWARQYMGTVFDEILWRTTGHYDHLHLGWIQGAEKFFDYIVNDLAGATEPVEKALQQAAGSTGVSFPLLAGLAKAESGFNPFAQSPVGAQGLTQLMPATARSVGVLNPFDPASNALGGAKYLSRMLNSFGGDVRMALAAYNAGPGNAARALQSFPETMAYVEKVLRYAREFGFRFGGFRAQGGPVMPGALYGVGERGPEAFVASDRGQIISAADLKVLVRAARDGEMMQPVQPMQVTFDTKVHTQSRDPEIAAALVDQRLAERIGSLSR